MSDLRIQNHPILGAAPKRAVVEFHFHDQVLQAFEGETVAAALIANGIRLFRYTRRSHEPRGLFCGIGQCTDCIMQVDGVPNVRTCVTLVQAGMRVEIQKGTGAWEVQHG